MSSSKDTSTKASLSVIQWLQKANKASGNGTLTNNGVDGSAAAGGGAWGGSADKNAWVDTIRLECPPISNPATQDAAFLNHIANLPSGELEMMIGEAALRKVYRVDAVCPKKSVESKHVAFGSTTSSTTKKDDNSAGPKKQTTEDIMQEFAGFIDVDDADEAALTSHVAGVSVSTTTAPRDPEYDHNATCTTGNCCAVPSCIFGIRVVKNNPQSIAYFVRKVMNRMGESSSSSSSSTTSLLSGTPKRPVPSGLERTISKSILHANYGEGDEGRAVLEGTLDHIINTCAGGVAASVHPRLIGDVPHTGLRNIRNTCYMNSVLQLLYHIPEVRQAVILASIPTSTTDSNANNNNTNNSGSLVELGLGQLFAAMMYGAVDVVDTYDVAVDGLRIDPREQQDAQEFLGLMLQLLTSVAPQPSLIEAMEPAVATDAKLSDLSNLRQVLTRAFESSQVYQRVCASCGGCKYRADTAPFHTVPLVKEACDEAINDIYRKATATAPIVVAETEEDAGAAVDVDEPSIGMMAQEESDQVDMSSFFDNESSSHHQSSFPAANTLPTLEASLLKLLSPGTIDGYSCEDCGANSTTNNVGITRMSLKKMPEYLVFHLGRFQYDLQKGDRVKINTALDFPNFLDMGKVMEEGSEVFNTVVAAMSKAGGEVPPTKVKDASGAECWYQLEAIVNHHGATPRSGHYTFSARCIRRTDSDDSSSLVRETVVVGGDSNSNANTPQSTTEPVWVHCDDGSISDLPARSFGAHQDRFKSKDAYLLVYRRVDKPTPSTTPSPTSATNTKAEAIEVDTPTPAPAPSTVAEDGDATPRKSATGTTTTTPNKKPKGGAAVAFAEDDIPTEEDDDDVVEVAQGSGITALTNLRNNASASLITALASNPSNWQTFLPSHIRTLILGGGDAKDSDPAFNPTIHRVYDQHVALKKYLTEHLTTEWLPLADAVFGTKGSKGKLAAKTTMLTSAKPVAAPEPVATTRSGRPIRPTQPVEVDESEEEEETVNTADERVFVPSAWLRLFGAVFSDRSQADKLLLNPQKQQACETSPPIRTKGRRVVPEGAVGAHEESATTPPTSSAPSFGYSSWSNDRRLRESRLASAFDVNGEMQESVLPFTINKAYAACLGYKHIPELLETAAQEGHGMLCIHGLIRPPDALPLQDLEESQLVRNSTIHTYSNHTAASHYKLIPKAAAKAIRDWAGVAGLLPLTSTNGMCRVCTAVEVLKLKSKRNVEKQEHLFRDACDQLQLYYKKWETADSDPQSQIKASASLRALRELAWVPAKFLDWWLSQSFSQATPTQATIDLTKRKKKTPTPKKSGGKKPNNNTKGSTNKSVQFAEEAESVSSAKDEDAVEPYDLSRHLLCKCYMANEDDGFGEPKTNTLPPTVAPFAACVPIPKEVFDYLVTERGFLATAPIVTTADGGECSAEGITQYLNPPRCGECVKTSTQGTQRQLRLRSEKHDQLKAISTAARVTAPAKVQQQREADAMLDAIHTGSRACVEVSNATEVGAIPHLHWLSLLCPVESQPGLSLEDAEAGTTPSSSSTAVPASAPLSLIGREINKTIFKKNLTTAVKAHTKAWEKDREAAEKVAAEEAQKKIVADFLGASKGGRGGRGGKVLNLSAKNAAVHIDCDAPIPEAKPSTDTTTSSSPSPPPFIGTTYVALPLPWVSVWHTWARQVEAALPPTIYPPTTSEGGTANEEVHMISDIIQNSQAAERARQTAKFPQAPVQTSTTTQQRHHEVDDDTAAGTADERATIRSILRRNLEASFQHLQASNHLFCPQHPGHLLIAPEDLNPVKCGYDISGGADVDECSNNGLFLPSAAQALSALGGVVKAGDTLTRNGVEKLTKVFNDYSNNPAYPPYVLLPYEELSALETCMLGGSEDAQQQQQQHNITTVFERHYPQLLVGGNTTNDNDSDDDVKVVPPPPGASRAPLPTGLPLLLLQEVNTERVMLSYPTCVECRSNMLLQREEALRTFGCGGTGGGVEAEEGGDVVTTEDGSIKVHMKIRKSKKGAFHQSVDTIGGVHGGTNMVVISQLCATSLLESHGLLVDAAQLQFFHSNKQLTTAQRGTAKDDKSIPLSEEVTLASQGVKNLGNLYCLFADGVAVSVGGDQAAVGESFGNNKGRAREEATFGSTRLGGLGGDGVVDGPMVGATGGGGDGGGVKECPICTYHNSSLLSTCEMCESPLM